MTKDLSLENKIEALFVCAEILEYPTQKAQDDFNSVIAPQFGCKFVEHHDDIEAEYISIFSINSTKLRCVPFASWWIDDKMSGKTLPKIVNFYAKCGYEYDAKMIKKPADNLSSMISFVAILAQENRFEEIKEFAKFLTWLDDFAISLEKATDIKSFFCAVSIANKIISDLTHYNGQNPL